jgi:hypothetical protein
MGGTVVFVTVNVACNFAMRLIMWCTYVDRSFRQIEGMRPGGEMMDEPAANFHASDIAVLKMCCHITALRK